MNRIVRGILIACLIGAMAVSGLFALKIQRGYTAEDAVHRDVFAFKPPPAAEAVDVGNADRPAFVNESIVALTAEYEGAVGWLTVPYTGIDYPFAQAETNTYYLNKDMDGEYLFSGTLFLDCRADKGFFDSNTVIYGHHMKNGTMFGPLAQYAKADFFETNKSGTVYLADKTYEIEFFAYLVVDADDGRIFDEPKDRAEMSANLSYIRENARNYREADVGPDDQIITLSTCAYEFKEARMVLVGKLSQIQ